MEMAASSANHFQLSFSSVVRGFHVYQAVWTPVLNAEYLTQQEHGKKALDGSIDKWKSAWTISPLKKAASIMTTWVAFI